MFKKLFKRKVEVSYNADTDGLKVIQVNPESPTISENRGMSDERFEELSKAVQLALVQYSDVCDVAAHVSEMCKHPNELFFVSFVIARKTASPIVQLKQLFGK